MKRNLKKGDGLATIVITVVLIVIVLLIIPVLRGYQASTGQNAKKVAETQTTLIEQAADGSLPSDSTWKLSDGTELKAEGSGGAGGSGGSGGTVQ